MTESQHQAPLRTGKRPLSPGARKALGILFWIVSAGVTLFVAAGFFLPRSVEVRREIQIQAPVEKVFAAIETLKRWPEWGPWFKRDRFIETAFEGPEAGQGSILKWKSKTEGEGQLKIIAASPGRTLRLAVDFGQAGDANCAFDLQATPAGETVVSWTFNTDFGQNMARRYFGLLLKPAVERDLDEGLSELKALLEAPPIAKP